MKIINLTRWAIMILVFICFTTSGLWAHVIGTDFCDYNGHGVKDNINEFYIPNGTKSSTVFVDSQVNNAKLLRLTVDQHSKAFHLFSHGRPGELLIEGQWRNAEEIAAWHQNLKSRTLNANFFDPTPNREVEDYLGALLPPEICGDGQDNDLDGFVDAFDPDCPCNDQDYANNCPLDCEYDPSLFPFAVDATLKYQSATPVQNYTTPILGDIDADGEAEFVMFSRNQQPPVRSLRDLKVINARTGVIELTISTPILTYTYHEGATIADVDNDGFGEIIVRAANISNNSVAVRGALLCYEHDGTLKWVSNVGFLTAGATIDVADFNEDGIPEVYTRNRIFNAQTGVLLVQGSAGEGASFTEGYGESYHIGATVAADLTAAAGLELAAGNTVYEVNITNTGGTAGNTMTPIVLAGYPDGMTSVADIDLDGNLDLVVNPESDLIYVWSPISNSLIAQRLIASRGRPFLGNMDEDCFPEIGFTSVNMVNALKYDGTTTLQVKWTLSISDGSGATGITMFDFNQDGKNELVYRDEVLLRIIDGSGASPVMLETIACSAGTGAESPIVADVDGDGAAEIAVTCSNRLRVFESASIPWAPARQVWNQLSYHVTNINDDLTVPQYQQSNAQLFPGGSCNMDCIEARPLNNFLQQSTILSTEGCPQFPASDLTISFVGVPTLVSGSDYTVTVGVCNLSGETVLAGNPINFYDDDPLNSATATLLSTSPSMVATTIDLPASTCEILTLQVNGLSGTEVYALTNDNASQSPLIVFPVTPVPECDYTNNIDAVEVSPDCPIGNTNPQLQINNN